MTVLCLSHDIRLRPLGFHAQAVTASLQNTHYTKCRLAAKIKTLFTKFCRRFLFTDTTSVVVFQSAPCGYRDLQNKPTSFLIAYCKTRPVQGSRFWFCTFSWLGLLSCI